MKQQDCDGGLADDDDKLYSYDEVMCVWSNFKCE